MPYSKKEHKVSNVNYLNKDFADFKSSLIDYAKTYFPNSYRDFNETSPGMMLIEMSAYVGDVLSYYIDQQYKEMMLPLAEERRNVINIAKTLGYKVKPINPALVDLKFTQTFDADQTDPENIIPNYSTLSTITIPKGTQVKASSDQSIIFETLDVMDFQVSASYDQPVEATGTDSNGLTNEFTITRNVKAISAETKTKTFTIGTPTKFLRLSLPETNVIEVIDVFDSNANQYYEVDFLAQDKVATETLRTNAYDLATDSGTPESDIVAVPYSLQYKRTSKKFITEVDQDNVTSLVFGNGLLRNGQIEGEDFLSTQQSGLTIPGEPDVFTNPIDPIANDSKSTLGETPSNTTLTVRYRVGGGLASNVPTGDLTTLVNSLTNVSVTNDIPAAGGSSGDTIEEIRQKAKSFFATQNRCVTKHDYEARIMAMPARFGNIAKVYVERQAVSGTDVTITTPIQEVTTTNQGITLLQESIPSEAIDSTEVQNAAETVAVFISALQNQLNQFGDAAVGNYFINNPEQVTNVNNALSILDIDEDHPFNLLLNNYNTLVDEVNTLNPNVSTNVNISSVQTATQQLGVIDIYILSYDQNKNLVRPNPNSQLIANLKNYLTEFRLITDEVNINRGYIVNFGVVFNVVAHKNINKAEVKVRCIQLIQDYFNIDDMQFRQEINVGELEYELMGVEGVRSVNHVTITQQNDYNDGNTTVFGNPLYHFIYDPDNTTGDFSTTGTNTQYNFQYDFKTAIAEGTKIIGPSTTPAVFELKLPSENIKGVVL